MPLFNTVSAITKLDTYNVKQLENAIKVLNDKLKEKDTTEPTRKKIEKMKKQYQAQITKTKGLFKKYSARGRLPGFNSATVSVQQMYKHLGVNVVRGNYAADTDTFWGKINAHPTAAASIVVGAGLGLHALLKLPGVKEGLMTALKEVGKFLFGGSPAALGVWAGALIIAPFIIGAIKKVMARNRALKLDVENAINKDSVYNIDNLGKEFEANKEKLIEDALTGGQKDEIIAHLRNVAATSTNTPTERANALKLVDEIEKAVLKNKTEEARLLVNGAFENNSENREILSTYYTLAEKNKKEQESLNEYNKLVVHKNNFKYADVALNGNGSTVRGKDKEYQDAIEAYNNELIVLGITDPTYKITDKDNPLKAGVAAKPASEFKDKNNKRILQAGTPFEQDYNSIISEFDGKIEVIQSPGTSLYRIVTSSQTYSTSADTLSKAIAELITKLDLDTKFPTNTRAAVKTFIKEYVASKVIQAKMQDKADDVTNKKAAYDTAKSNYDSAKSNYDAKKEEIDDAKLAHTDALNELNSEGARLLGSDWSDFATVESNTKDKVISVLEKSKLFSTSKITEFRTKNLEELLQMLKNFIPGKDKLNKDMTMSDSSLFK